VPDRSAPRVHESAELAQMSAGWQPARPHFNLPRRLIAWLVAAGALLIGAWLIPGASTKGAGSLLAVAAIAALNAVFPPLIAALRIPLTLATGFVLILLIDPLMLVAAMRLTRGALTVESYWSALGVAIVASAASLVLEAILGTNDDDTYTLRVIQRIARRSGQQKVTDTAGIVFLEVDGLALPVLQRAMRDGSAPNLASWVVSGTHRLVEWETDLSSQTGASQAGILLGDNDDIPAFRWVEKESGSLMTCSAPRDCAEIEKRHASGNGLLADGGASRGNLLSGEADEVILTASRIEAEKGPNPGYRAFFANGFNVTRSLVLFAWEVALEVTAAARTSRRNVWPRGNRGGIYPLLRAALCVVVRDLIVYGVLTDMMKGRPAIYATFSSYDEVAHHSGLERVDTMEALRKLDQQIERISRARPYAARPYWIVVLSDHGQTQGATFEQRNGYGLDDLVRQSVDSGNVPRVTGGDENDHAVGNAFAEGAGRPKQRLRSHSNVTSEQVVVLGSGNLALVYLMEKHNRMCLEEIELRHPRLLPTLRRHPHIGWLLVHSSTAGPVVLGPQGTRYLARDLVDGVDPLAGFSRHAADHLTRTDGFPHVADIVVGSFYDAGVEEGCAFEDLISFHGGLGGTQTRPFLLYPVDLPAPDEPIVGACRVHDVLLGWRRLVNQQRGGRQSPGVD